MAVVVFGIVGALLTRSLVAGQRIHQAHVRDVVMNESARAALALLPAQFRELSAGGGDIIALDSGAITFKAARGLYVLCADPDPVALTLLLDGELVYGSEALDGPDDSLLIFAEGDPATRLDDGWISAGTSAAASGSSCPGGAPSIALGLTGVAPAQLGRVRAGAPLRPFRPAQILAYPDALGDWWIGQRLYLASSGTWSTVQPVLGPLAVGGLALTYLDAVGTPAVRADAVARIGIRVVTRSPGRVRRADGAEFLMREVAMQVVLRNNPRY